MISNPSRCFVFAEGSGRRGPSGHLDDTMSGALEYPIRRALVTWVGSGLSTTMIVVAAEPSPPRSTSLGVRTPLLP